MSAALKISPALRLPDKKALFDTFRLEPHYLKSNINKPYFLIKKRNIYEIFTKLFMLLGNVLLTNNNKRFSLKKPLSINAS